ncbi:MFS transporter [Streptomyces sp. 5-6(2022)]|uniref:MFS transporter n=1 Tax=Streptomyces sp. 5-6(2022) TaxID=2936510 RepID=UPI0023B8A7AE|nr:MFS transporter [Streptomyces sp. 5-6(2022)]
MTDVVTLRESFQIGGRRTIFVLSGLAVLDAADNAGFGVLAPDIRESLRLSTTTITVIGALAGFAVSIAALPLGVLGDRMRRTAIAGVSTLLWAVASVLCSVAQVAWQLVLIRTLSGIGKANEGPVQSALLTDAYPPRGRGKIFAIHRAGLPVGILLGPALLGGVASLAGGDDGWRWAFAFMAVPAVILGVTTLFLPEPERGKFEQLEMPGHSVATTPDDPEVTLSAAFARLKKVRTFNLIMVSLGAFGFAVTTVPIYLSIVMDHHFHLGVGERGAVVSVTSVGALLGAVVGGKYADQLFARSPERCMYAVGAAIAALGCGLGLQAYAPNVTAFIVIGFITQGLLYLAPIASVVAAAFLVRGARTVRADVAQAAAKLAS